MYRAVTRQIEVTVEPNFLPERSSAENRQFFWSYTVVITNSGKETVQLRTRHWIITDASGRKQEIRGEGVVGEQPVLAPGERFEYTSGVPLPTASGFMTGRYQMVTESGERFEIDVPDVFARQSRRQAGAELRTVARIERRNPAQSRSSRDALAPPGCILVPLRLGFFRAFLHARLLRRELVHRAAELAGHDHLAVLDHVGAILAA